MKSRLILFSILIASIAHAGTLTIDLKGPKSDPCWTKSGTPWYGFYAAVNGTRIQLDTVAPQLTEGVLTFDLRAFGEQLPAGTYTKVETKLVDNTTSVYRPFAAMYIVTTNDWWWRLGTTYGGAPGIGGNGFGPYFGYPWGDLVVPGEPPYHFPTGDVTISYEHLSDNGMITAVNGQQYFNWAPGFWGGNMPWDRIALSVRLWSDVGHGATFEYLRITNDQMSVLRGVVAEPGLPLPRSLSVQFVSVATGAVFNRTMFPAVDGTYTLPATLVGQFHVYLDGAPELRTYVGDYVLNGGDVNLAPVVMATGDVDSSGEVDAADIDLVIAHFGDLQGTPTYVPATDVDRSGEVDAADIDLVILNFGAVDQ